MQEEREARRVELVVSNRTILRLLAIAAAFVTLLYVCYLVREVLLLGLISLFLALILNPAVTALERRLGWKRQPAVLTVYLSVTVVARRLRRRRPDAAHPRAHPLPRPSPGLRRPAGALPALPRRRSPVQDPRPGADERQAPVQRGAERRDRPPRDRRQDRDRGHRRRHDLLPDALPSSSSCHGSRDRCTSSCRPRRRTGRSGSPSRSTRRSPGTRPAPS